MERRSTFNYRVHQGLRIGGVALAFAGAGMGLEIRNEARMEMWRYPAFRNVLQLDTLPTHISNAQNELVILRGNHGSVYPDPKQAKSELAQAADAVAFDESLAKQLRKVATLLPDESYLRRLDGVPITDKTFAPSREQLQDILKSSVKQRNNLWATLPQSLRSRSATGDGLIISAMLCGGILLLKQLIHSELRKLHVGDI